MNFKVNKSVSYNNSLINSGKTRLAIKNQGLGALFIVPTPLESNSGNREIELMRG